jgi:hypothetical protein
MTEKRSLPLDDLSALDTARGADREQREETFGRLCWDQIFIC